MVRLLHFLVSVFTSSVRTRLSLQLEIAALRRQLSAYISWRGDVPPFAQPIGCSGRSWRGSGPIGAALVLCPTTDSHGLAAIAVSRVLAGT